MDIFLKRRRSISIVYVVAIARGESEEGPAIFGSEIV